MPTLRKGVQATVVDGPRVFERIVRTLAGIGDLFAIHKSHSAAGKIGTTTRLIRLDLQS